MPRLTRRLFAAALVPALMVSSAALAHHGWSWTTGGNIELTGIIQSARLGNPHGVLKVDADGEIWTVEVGQPWRNSRAGLSDGDFAEGTEITIEGEPAADMDEKLMKAERITIAGTLYELYPGRS